MKRQCYSMLNADNTTDQVKKHFANPCFLFGLAMLVLVVSKFDISFSKEELRVSASLDSPMCIGGFKVDDALSYSPDQGLVLSVALNMGGLCKS